MPEDFVAHNGVNLVDIIEQPAWKTILLSLVNSEKMDVWNIDISKLADKYLEKINSLSNENLRVPANAILASAILLRFKARIIQISSIEEDKDIDENSVQDSSDLDKAELQVFQEILPELKNIRRIKEGRISLDSLVDAIGAILEKSKKKRDASFERQSASFKIPFSDFNLEKKMAEVYDLICSNLDSQGIVTFSELANGKDTTEIIRTFIPCLFLFNKGKINMWQETFWDTIFISLTEKA